MQELQTISFLQSRVAYVRDEAAYQKLFYHFHPGLYRFCYSIIGDPEVAEELVSDIMLKLWLMGNKLAYIDDLRLYVYKAVKNACFTYLSQQKRRITSVATEAENDIPDPSGSSDQQLLNTEAQQQLEKAVTSLPPQCQMVFRLIRENGFSHKQVGQVLEISKNTIETHMRIALQRIKSQLESYLSGKK